MLFKSTHNKDTKGKEQKLLREKNKKIFISDWKQKELDYYVQRRKMIEIDGYVLSSMASTLETSHFETSLLNSGAPLKAVSIIEPTKRPIQKNKIIKRKKNKKMFSNL